MKASKQCVCEGENRDANVVGSKYFLSQLGELCLKFLSESNIYTVRSKDYSRELEYKIPERIQRALLKWVSVCANIEFSAVCIIKRAMN